MTLPGSLWQLVLQMLLASTVIRAEPFLPEDAVREASSILTSISSTSPNLASTRQTGLTYYAREIFTQLFLSTPLSSSSSASLPSRSDELEQALHFLDFAASQDSPDALFILAEMHFYGNYSLTRNFSTAFTNYERLAGLNGNATAQHMLGFMYATGIGGAVAPDQAKAMLYYTFAAEAGSINADMAVAYRYHTGVASPKNCDESVHYYKKVADRAMDYIRSGPPGGHMVVKDSYPLADEVGGVYGEGASVSSSGMNGKHGPAHGDAHASVEDVVEYLDLMSRKGDLSATYSLAKLYYDGSRGMKRDLARARKHFLEVARVVWPKRGSRNTDIDPKEEKFASKAAGFLGRMFLRAEGVKQDFSLAEVWFKRGVSNGDPLSQYSLGIMYLNGLVPSQEGNPDPYRAYEYFLPAADADLASAQVRLAVFFLDQGDTTTALQYFDHAARNGHIEAYYYLAELSYQGIGRDQSCHVAAAYYKIVAEKAEIILASFKEANEAFASGDLETALIDYLLAAEQGFESAQANVAYILDSALPTYKSVLTIGNAGNAPRQIAHITPDSPALALVHWTRSAKQQNIDSLLKMGDYYLQSLGTPPAVLYSPSSHHQSNEEKAAQCYQAAAETMHSAQAYWNLGWMHENGVGMGQDFHLAKRFYDLSLETNKEAYLPVKLALGKLRARSAWNRIIGKKGVRSIEDESTPRKSWTEWLNAFLEADAALYRTDQHAHHHDDPLLDDDRDDWYNAGGGTPGGDYDELEFDEEGLLESVLIIGAAALLMCLVVYRRRRNEERERERLGLAPGAPVPGQPQLQPDGGLFPQPGEQGFENWVAGGVGH